MSTVEGEITPVTQVSQQPVNYLQKISEFITNIFIQNEFIPKQCRQQMTANASTIFLQFEKGNECLNFCFGCCMQHYEYAVSITLQPNNIVSIRISDIEVCGGFMGGFIGIMKVQKKREKLAAQIVAQNAMFNQSNKTNFVFQVFSA